MKLGYLGPSGTYSEMAARTYRVDAEMTPYPSIPAVAEAVEHGDVEQAVVPIENSLQGAVTEVVDFLLNSAATRIRGELAIPIAHCLLGRAGTRIEDIEVVYSHPQALGQCHRYLRGNLPHAELQASASTAGSVSDMLASERPAAAIAPRRAAEIYGVETLAEGIQDNPRNYTRFVVLAGDDHESTGRDKTSIAFSYSGDRPGLLYDAMGVFASRGINLTKIESRPTGERLGRYVFLVDLEGHRKDQKVAEALDDLRRMAARVDILGSYPRMQDIPVE